MNQKTFSQRSKSHRSLIGAVAFGTLGAAVVFVPKVRKAVVGAAGTAFDTIQDKCRELAASASPDPKTAEKARKTPTAQDTQRSVAAKRKGAAKRKVAAKRKGGTTKSTAPGFVNENDQETLRRVGKSESWKGQYVYELRCRDCGHHYGTNGPEIKTRQCPECQDGSAGEAI